MMTVNGVTWTTKDETFTLFNEFRERYGVNIVEPACDYGKKPCGATTTYIYEEAEVRLRPDGRTNWIKPKRKGLACLLNAMPTAVYFSRGDGLYFPVRLCHKCSAAIEGANCADFDPAGKKAMLASVDKMALTAEEKVDWRRIFCASFDKHMAAKPSPMESAAKKNRYKMTGGRA